jgi:hypothetical protein
LNRIGRVGINGAHHEFVNPLRDSAMISFGS